MTIRDLEIGKVGIEANAIIRNLDEKGIELMCSVFNYSDDVANKSIKKIYIDKKSGALVFEV